MAERNHEICFRVRYSECDPMGVAHHSAYAPWFEMGRTELLRRDGIAYADLEQMGIFLAVVELNIRYRRAVRYDEELTLETTLVDSSRVKLIHEYTLRREHDVLSTARTVLACVGTEGRATALPGVVLKHAQNQLGINTDDA